jgi:nucleotide-binding universal stress UspA family protein
MVGEPVSIDKILHGRGGLTRFWLGSVADELVRRLPVPPLLRPDAHTPSAAAAHTPRRMLIPLDGSANVEVAQQGGIDVIAMATHGRRGLARVLLGSVADKVLLYRAIAQQESRPI